MNVSLAEWAATDAEWFVEAYTLLVAYREGQQMAAGVQKARQQMQA